MGVNVHVYICAYTGVHLCMYLGMYIKTLRND